LANLRMGGRDVINACKPEQRKSDGLLSGKGGDKWRGKNREVEREMGLQHRI